MSPQSKRRNSSTKSESVWIESLKTVGMSVMFAFGLRTFAAQAYYIPSGSMEPTLQIDDKIVVDKVSYHFRLPRRGEIVVFQPPELAIRQCGALNTHDAWVKRIIGIPGDKVEVQNHQVLINEHLVRESYISQRPSYKWGPAIVPKGSYLVLGDNRQNSCDGHYWGFLPQDRLVGRAFVRYWPPARFGVPN
jgi:signal peptidase I